MAFPSGRHRPLRPGCGVARSVEEPPFEQGTLGAFVRDADGTLYILSNAHVLVQDPFKLARPETRIRQPPSTDSEASPVASRDAVASVSAHSVIAAEASRIDAALAKLDGGIEVDPAIPDCGKLLGVRQPVKGERLWMVSKTQGLHSAIVHALDVKTEIDVLGRKVLFIGQVELISDNLGGPAMKGDSGGVWFGEDNRACLLNFAGWNYLDPDSMPRTISVKQRETPKTIQLPAYDADGNPAGTLDLQSNQDIEARPAQGYGAPLSAVLAWASEALGKSCELLLSV